MGVEYFMNNLKDNIDTLKKKKDLLERLKKLNLNRAKALVLAGIITFDITAFSNLFITFNDKKPKKETISHSEINSEYIVLEDGTKVYKSISKLPLNTIETYKDKSIYDISAKSAQMQNYPVVFEGEDENDINNNIYLERNKYDDIFNLVAKTYGLDKLVKVHDGRTTTMLDVVCAVIIGEGYGEGKNKYDLNGNSYEKGASYKECHGIASLLFKRIQDILWINGVEEEFGKGTGQNLYYQVIAKNQFEAYYKYKTYLKYLGKIDLPGYQAALDMFMSGKASINYQEFRGWYTNTDNNNYLVVGGNRYLRPFDESNHVDLPFSLPNEIYLNNENTLTLS